MPKLLIMEDVFLKIKDCCVLESILRREGFDLEQPFSFNKIPEYGIFFEQLYFANN
jgi:hypothetical protein